MMRPGRRESAPTTVSIPTAEHFLSDARIVLTFLESVLYRGSVARGSELAEALKERLQGKSDSLESVTTEMNTLRSAYNRYRDLAEQKEQLRQETLRLAAVLAPQLSPSDMADIFADDVASIGTMQEMRGRVALWEVLAVILEQTGEIRVFELDMLLSTFNINGTRQAVESAIDTHRKVFSVRRKGREKYVSLRKGA
jgi:hypothetical protein